MSRINHQSLRRQWDAAKKDKTPQRFVKDFRDALEKRELRPEEFSVRALFEEFVENGRELVRDMDPRQYGNGPALAVLEGTGAVSTSDFSHITGQIVYSRMREAFEAPSLLFNDVCTVVPTQFNGEKIPGVSGIGDEASTVAEGETYPLAGVSEEYLETPQTTKRGFIVPVTKEAVFFDRTGMVLARCGEVAEFLAINREKRVLDALFGITNSYKYNGTSNDTYQATTPWINIKATNALVDWTDIENAELLFDAMTDPTTGEPINVMPDTIIVPSALKHTARRIVNATEIRFGDGASATTQGISDNPLRGSSYKVLSSPYVKARTSSASTWFCGQPKRALWYMENWGLTVIQAPSNSEAEFTQDVIARFKASERGATAIVEPRRMVKSTA